MSSVALYEPTNSALVPHVQWLLEAVSRFLPVECTPRQEIQKLQSLLSPDIHNVPMEVVEILAAGSLYQLAFSVLCQAPVATSIEQPSISSIRQKSTTPLSENYLVNLVGQGLVKFTPALCESILEMLGDVEPFYEAIHINVMEGYMSAHTNPVTLHAITTTIKSFPAFNGTRDTPYDVEDALLIWIAHVCHLEATVTKAPFESFANALEDMDDLVKDLEDGRALACVLLHHLRGLYKDVASLEHSIIWHGDLSVQQKQNNLQLVLDCLAKVGCVVSWTAKDFQTSMETGAWKKVIVVTLSALFGRLVLKQQPVPVQFGVPKTEATNESDQQVQPLQVEQGEEEPIEAEKPGANADEESDLDELIQFHLEPSQTADARSSPEQVIQEVADMEQVQEWSDVLGDDFAESSQRASPVRSRSPSKARSPVAEILPVDSKLRSRAASSFASECASCYEDLDIIDDYLSTELDYNDHQEDGQEDTELTEEKAHSTSNAQEKKRVLMAEAYDEFLQELDDACEEILDTYEGDSSRNSEDEEVSRESKDEIGMREHQTPDPELDAKSPVTKWSAPMDSAEVANSNVVEGVHRTSTGSGGEYRLSFEWKEEMLKSGADTAEEYLAFPLAPEEGSTEAVPSLQCKPGSDRCVFVNTSREPVDSTQVQRKREKMLQRLQQKNANRVKSASQKKGSCEAKFEYTENQEAQSTAPKSSADSPLNIKTTAASSPVKTGSPLKSPRRVRSASRSNRQIIKNAILHLLGGALFDDVRKEVLQILDRASAEENFLILLRSKQNHIFRGLYSFDLKNNLICKLYGPSALPDQVQQASDYFKYDSSSQVFRHIQASEFSATIHGFSMI